MRSFEGNIFGATTARLRTAFEDRGCQQYIQWIGAIVYRKQVEPLTDPTPTEEMVVLRAVISALDWLPNYGPYYVARGCRLPPTLPVRDGGNCPRTTVSSWRKCTGGHCGWHGPGWTHWKATRRQRPPVQPSGGCRHQPRPIRSGHPSMMRTCPYCGRWPKPARGALTQNQIESSDKPHVSRRTVSERMPRLLADGLVALPQGKKKGYTITQSGLDVLKAATTSAP